MPWAHWSLEISSSISTEGPLETLRVESGRVTRGVWQQSARKQMGLWIKPEKLSCEEGGLRDNKRVKHMGFCDTYGLPLLSFPFWINWCILQCYFCVIVFPLSDGCICSQVFKKLKFYSFNIHQILPSSPLETWTFNHFIFCLHNKAQHYNPPVITRSVLSWIHLHFNYNYNAFILTASSFWRIKSQGLCYNENKGCWLLFSFLSEVLCQLNKTEVEFMPGSFLPVGKHNGSYEKSRVFTASSWGTP